MHPPTGFGSTQPRKNFEYRSSYFGSRSLFQTKISNHVNMYKRERHKIWQKSGGGAPQTKGDLPLICHLRYHNVQISSPAIEYAFSQSCFRQKYREYCRVRALPKIKLRAQVVKLRVSSQRVIELVSQFQPGNINSRVQNNSTDCRPQIEQHIFHCSFQLISSLYKDFKGGILV